MVRAWYITTSLTSEVGSRLQNNKIYLSAHGLIKVPILRRTFSALGKRAARDTTRLVSQLVCSSKLTNTRHLLVSPTPDNCLITAYLLV